MKRYLAFAIVTLGLSSPGAAFALSCKLPRVDEKVVNAASIIFEGTAGPGRQLETSDIKAVESQSTIHIGNRARHWRVYTFNVMRGWKGVTTGQHVQLASNAIFVPGEFYLVISRERIGEFFLSHVCEINVDLKFAADSGFLATLERLLGDPD